MHVFAKKNPHVSYAIDALHFVVFAGLAIHNLRFNAASAGIFYAQGVKTNVFFFDRKPAAEKPWTDNLWIYDLRPNKHFTLKKNPLKRR